MSDLYLYNTLSRKKEKFVPLESNVVKMYNCGPTVYFYAHIGNFKSFLLADVLHRYLKYKGFDVQQVMNITDVGHMTQDELDNSGDDKMEVTAKKENKTSEEVAQFYTAAFLKDWSRLNMLEPMARPKATEYIKPMVDMIQKLIDNGFAYESNGSVYFDVLKFDDYTKLSGNSLAQLQEGAGGRADNNPDKKSHLDFTLWVNNPDHIMHWKTPWSIGYPGWHIECSAMASDLLGEQIDIHTGGEDHIFPHHSCEIAQSEGASGKKFSNFWLHVKHMLVNGEKMSKSLGNDYTVQDLVDKGYNLSAIRYVLIAGSYRAQNNFTFDAIDDATTTLSRLRDFIDKLKHFSGPGKNNADVTQAVKDSRKKFEAAMDDDLNVSEALSAMFSLVSTVNKALDDSNISTKNVVAVLSQMELFDMVLGVMSFDGEEAPAKVQDLVDAREKARSEKDWVKADELRDQVSELGFVITDTDSGPVVKKKL